MVKKPKRAFKYGNQQIRITTVQVVEELGGAATIKQVDSYLRKIYPHYRDNTRSNLAINTVNCNRSHWDCNKVARRTDDTAHRYHEYDRLFKRGKILKSINPLFMVYGSYTKINRVNGVTVKLSRSLKWLLRLLQNYSHPNGSKF